MREGAEGFVKMASDQRLELAREKERIEAEMSGLCLRLESVEKQLRLLDELLNEIEGPAAGQPTPAEPWPESLGERHLNSGESHEARVTASNAQGVVDLAYTVLFERGREPMHYTDLARAVIEQGGKLGGVRPAQTLVSRIASDDRFVRPAKRGYYSLKVFHPRAKNVGARKVTRRRARLPVRSRRPDVA